MEFDEVIEKSSDLESLNENGQKYLDDYIFTEEERHKHSWALFYK